MFEKRSVPAPHGFGSGQTPLWPPTTPADSRHQVLSSRPSPARLPAAPPGAPQPAGNPLDRMQEARVRPKRGPAAPGGLPVRASTGRSREVRKRLRRFARTVLTAMPLACAALAWNGAAQADTVIWSATLIVQDTTFGSQGCNNEVHRYCSDQAVLSDDDFTHNGRNYQITKLYGTYDNLMHLFFNRDMSCSVRDLTLHVGDQAFPFGNSFCSPTNRFWFRSLVQWRLNYAISISLTTSADSDPETGLPLISVTDTGAVEGTDETVDFEVTMSRASTETVTVNYGTSSGTAQAGADYVATAGTLTFAPGETEKTVQVTLLDDAVDEGRETFRLKLSEAWGAVIADGDATVWVSNGDPAQGAWLGRFGRTVASQIVDAVSARLLDGPRNSQVTLAGQRVNLARGDGEAGGPPRGWETDPTWTGHDAGRYARGMWPERREGDRGFFTQTMTGRGSVAQQRLPSRNRRWRGRNRLRGLGAGRDKQLRRLAHGGGRRAGGRRRSDDGDRGCGRRMVALAGGSGAVGERGIRQVRSSRRG